MSMHSRELPLVSIIINNYNYGQFLKDSIDSALNQSYPKIEVIVVDDGSTDNSKNIIESFNGKITPILKENGGQCSAFNAGFAASHGEVICFLDSDDTFYSNKVGIVVNSLKSLISTHKLILIYHLLEIVNDKSVSMGHLIPDKINEYPSNIYDWACKYRYLPYEIGGTSGISLTKELCNIIFPLPEKQLPTCADVFVGYAACLFGKIYGVNQALTKYRVHDINVHRWSLSGSKNIYKGMLYDKNLRVVLDEYLNDKLIEYNKSPIISFFNSIYSVSYYYNNNELNKLIKLPWKMLKWHIDGKTIYYSCLSYYLALKICLNNIGNLLMVRKS